MQHMTLLQLPPMPCQAKGDKKASSAICVLKHTVENHGNISEMVPTLTRAADVYSLTKKQIMVPKDHLAVMGLPVYKNLQECSTCDVPFQALLKGSDGDSLSSAQIKQLAGNAISMRVVGAICCYIFTNLVRHSDMDLGDLVSDNMAEKTEAVKADDSDIERSQM
jgi:hypothetical protein